VPTHRIGIALLRGQFKEAAHMVLQGRDTEKPEIKRARDLFLVKGDMQVGAWVAVLLLLLPLLSSLCGSKHWLATAGQARQDGVVQTARRPLACLHCDLWVSCAWTRSITHRLRGAPHMHVCSVLHVQRGLLHVNVPHGRGPSGMPQRLC
jgi:hypothetical protein